MPGLERPRVLVMIPTFNEAENIAELIAQVLALKIAGLEIAVVDDASPDGTAEIAAEAARLDPRVTVISRRGPAGRGRAGRDGFLHGLRRGADFLVEMDADFSHQPRHIPALLAAAAEADVAVGSRFAAGASDRDRGAARRLLTRASGGYARRLYGLGVRDVNSGFRCFTRRALADIDPASLRSPGPTILQEILWRAARRGLAVKEIPIEFVDRRRGDSKLGLTGLVSACFWLHRLRFAAAN